MLLTRRQAQKLINQFKNLSINRQFQMAAPVVKYVLIPFEGNINHGDPQVIKLYPQATKDIDKKSDQSYISVSNTKDIIDNFSV